MKNQIIIGIVALAMGIGFGYALWGCRDHTATEQATSMNHTMEGMTSGLAGKTGDAFDAAFLSEMIVHHEGAVEMAESVLNTSERPELLQLANEIITAQTKEIEMMEKWKSEWFR